MASFNLGGNGGVSTRHKLLNPFSFLLDDETVKGVLRTFAYFRSDIELKVVSSSSVFDYGLVFVSHIPFFANSGTSVTDSWYTGTDPTVDPLGWSRIVNHNAAVIDVSQQQELVLPVPWITPAQYLLLSQYYADDDETNAGVALMANVMMLILHDFGTLSDGTGSDISFRVYARFVNPMVQGFCENNGSLSVIQAQAQSYAPLFQGAFDQASAAFSGWLERQAREGVTGGLNFAFSEGKKKFSDWYGQGSDESTFQNVEHSNVSQIPDMWGDVANNRVPSKKVFPWKDVPVPRHSLLEYIQQPCLRDVREFTASGTEHFEDPGILNAGPAWVIGRGCDRLSFMSQFFRFWRGSIVYSFYFVTSPLVSSRFQISLRWTPNRNTGAESTDEINKIVTVRGSTIVSFTIPYLYPAPWVETIPPLDQGSLEFSFQIPYIYVERISPIVTQRGIDGSVQMFTFRHAGPDFEFSSIRSSSYCYPRDPPIVAEAQMFLSDLSKSSDTAFCASYENNFHGSGVKYIEEVAMRWDISQTSSFYALPLQNSTLWGLTNYDAVSSLFMFFRGSTDVRTYVKDVDTATSVSLQVPSSSLPTVFTENGLLLGNGCAVIDPRYTSVFEVRSPAMGRYDWFAIYRDIAGQDDPYYLGDYDGFLLSLSPIVHPSTATGFHFGDFFRKMSDTSGYYYSIPPPSPLTWPINSSSVFRGSPVSGST